jgi:hypothetical protein
MVGNPWFLAAGGIIALLSLAAAVAGPLPDLVKEETEVENFKATPTNKRSVTQFVLPLDAPLETIPEGSNGYCTDPVLEWLRGHGREIPPYQRITIQNTAQEGAMLSIANVRAVEVAKRPSEPLMLFQCPDGGAGDVAKLDLRLDRQAPADRVADDGSKQPFVFNLEPGEQGVLELHLLGDMGNTYSGRIEVDVTTAGRTETVRLPLNGGKDTFDRISPGRYARLVVNPGVRHGEFSCLTRSPDAVESGELGMDFEVASCSPEDIRARLAAVGEA